MFTQKKIKKKKNQQKHRFEQFYLWKKKENKQRYYLFGNI